MRCLALFPLAVGLSLATTLDHYAALISAPDRSLSIFRDRCASPPYRFASNDVTIEILDGNRCQLFL
ncbi:hypothetical protein A9K55_001490 [Cordyceps militaris]|uniref:Uncharacterized protein n=1 Tax=Cordyceps militaris TaxID=73501 RepID=A0A2H4SRC7_CORMI|nr:hypothetical protein A9K55_001490 [Cordyceps militaris]